MGLATHNPNGQGRLGLSAAVASAVLYSVVVLFGVGPASPSAPGAAVDHRSSVVLASLHDPAVTGPGQRLPQASPGPVRHSSNLRTSRLQIGLASKPVAVQPSRESPPPPTLLPSSALPKPSPRVVEAVLVSEQPSAALPVPTIPLPDLTSALPLPQVSLPPLPTPLPLSLLPPASLPLP